MGYGRGLGDPRVPGVGAVACRLLGHQESQGVGVDRWLVREVRKSAKMSLMRAVCAVRASSSVWMAGDTSPAANVWFRWIAKTGHKLSEAGRPVVRSWGAMASVWFPPSRWNLHASDQSLVCGHPRWAHRHRQ